MLVRSYEMLKKHEGFRSFPYKCTAGKLTIGYGFNLDAGITSEEADFLLKARVDRVEKWLASHEWYRALDENRRDVLSNMAYNLGVAGLFKFKNMIKALEDGDYNKAAEEMLDSKWASQVKGRAIELAEIMRG